MLIKIPNTSFQIAAVAKMHDDCTMRYRATIYLDAEEQEVHDGSCAPPDRWQKRHTLWESKEECYSEEQALNEAFNHLAHTLTALFVLPG